jgi:hypothetical protein
MHPGRKDKARVHFNAMFRMSLFILTIAGEMKCVIMKIVSMF